MHDDGIELEKSPVVADLRSNIYLIAFSSLLLALALTCLLLLAVAALPIKETDFSRIQEIFAVPLRMFEPEPLERRLFVAGVFGFPFLLMASWLMTVSFVPRLKGDRRLVSALWSVIITALFFFSGLAVYGLRGSWFISGISTSMVTASIAVSCVTVLAFCPRKDSTPAVCRAISWGSDLLAGMLIATVALFSVYGINAVHDATVYNYHLNSVLHAVVQVFHGKELLVDLSHIYGLYPHFLEPIFRLTGLTVLSFTIVMGLLTGVSYLFLYMALRGLAGSAPLACLGLSSILYFNYALLRVTTQDPYFQYHPIRFFFPALTIYLAYRYVSTPRRSLYFTMFFVSASALLWNFDTGFVVYFSWLLLLLYRESPRLSLKNVFPHICWGIIVLAATVTVFSCYLFLRFGKLPDYGMFFNFQKLFIGYGYMMLPMPLVHPWNVVILVYMAGLVYAVSARALDDISPRPSFVFFLSILGIGIFSYYQGRSHDHCLVLVCYPAFMLLTILAAGFTQQIRKGAGIFKAITAGTILLIPVVSTLAFLGALPRFLDIALGRIAPTIQGAASPALSGAEFVSHVTGRGEGVLILSNLSGVYYLTSGTSCPVNVPGPTELFLAADYQRIYSYLIEHPRTKVIVDDNFVFDRAMPGINIYKEEIWNLLAARYRLVAQSPEKNLALFITGS